ncbi:MAG: TRAP transporter substrate-binding protein [Saccharospirillum sp.]|nr:TRAP transporter substrate-binding protein [Saccharospirillum sp.]
MSFKLKTLCVSLAAITSLSAAGIAHAQTDLRLASWVPDTHPLSRGGFEPWMESITEASNGSLTFTLYPAQQLGASADHHDMARQGISDISYTNFSYTPGRFPIAGAAEIPFVISDPIAASGVYHDWYQEHGTHEVKGAKVCMLFLQPTGALHTNGEQVVMPEDLNGLSMRPPNANVANLFSNLGASNVQVSAPESREAMARGVVDGIGFPWDSMKTFGIDASAKYHLDVPLYVNVFGLIMNQNSYDRLSAADKAVIDDHCSAQWSGRLIEHWSEAGAQARQAFIDDPEHTVYTPTQAEEAVWVEASSELQSTWAAAVRNNGDDPDALWQDLTERLRAVNALYGE